MKKQELKELIRESIDEVVLEQKIHEADLFLNEEFEKSAIALEEQYELHREVINEGIITEEQVDEAFFDTIKNLGKNTISAIKGAWDKAKEQGDRDELARLQKKVADLKKKNPKAFEKAVSDFKKDPKGAKAVDAGKTEKPKKPASQKTKQKVAAAIVDQVVDNVKKADPKLAQKLAATKPEKLQKAVQDPKVQAEKAKIVDELKQEPENPKQPGLVGKLWSWAKKNPVKGIAALGLMAIAAQVAGPAILAGAVGGALKGAGFGAVGGAAVDAFKQLKDTGKLDMKQLFKATLSGAGKGAVGGAIVGGAGGLLGQILNNMTSAVPTSAKEVLAADPNTSTEVSKADLDKAYQTLDSSEERVADAVANNEIPKEQVSPLRAQLGRMEQELMAKGKALNSLGLTKASVYNMNDGNFKIVGSDGAEHIFNKAGAEITDPATLDSLNAAEPSVAQRQAIARDMAATVNRNRTVSRDAPSF